MEIAQALEFVSHNSRTVLATRRVDGSVQMSPVNSGVIDGRVVISSRAMLVKVRNLERDPAAAVLVMNEKFYGSWVQIEGPAQIIRQPEALDLLVEVYRSISGEHPDWEDYRAAMIRDERVVISIDPQRASGVSGF